MTTQGKCRPSKQTDVIEGKWNESENGGADRKNTATPHSIQDATANRVQPQGRHAGSLRRQALWHH